MEKLEYYSQSGQDKWVDNFFKQSEGNYYIEIGAYDGIKYSNTYFLEKNRNWNGMCIEADPGTFKQLVSNRKCTCINKAISDTNGTIKFKSLGLTGKIANDGVEVESITLAELFKQHNVPNLISYISLDIEGNEVKALNGFPWKTHEFILMTVEHNLYQGNRKHKDDIYNILTRNGYTRIVEDVEDKKLKYEDWYINNKYL